MITETEHTSTKRSSGFFSRWNISPLEAVGYVGAVVASILTMYANVRMSFHNRMKKGLFSHLYKNTMGKITELGIEVEEGRIESKEFWPKLEVITKEYKKTWNAGLERIEIKNIFDRFGKIHPADQFKTIAFGMTVFGVGLGAMGRNTRKSFVEKHQSERKETVSVER